MQRGGTGWAPLGCPNQNTQTHTDTDAAAAATAATAAAAAAAAAEQTQTQTQCKTITYLLTRKPQQCGKRGCAENGCTNRKASLSTKLAPTANDSRSKPFRTANEEEPNTAPRTTRKVYKAKKQTTSIEGLP